MAIISRPERFVSYSVFPKGKLPNGDGGDAGGLIGEVPPGSQIESLLEDIRRMIAGGDQLFDGRRYGAALEAYRAASAMILGIVVPRPGPIKDPPPKKWPDAVIGGALLEASARMLTALPPAHAPEPLVALSTPLNLPLELLGRRELFVADADPPPVKRASKKKKRTSGASRATPPRAAATSAPAARALDATLAPARMLKRRLVLDGSAIVSWPPGGEIAPNQILDNLIRPRAASGDPQAVGFPQGGPVTLAAYLPVIYHFVLPLKMGDCHHQLDEFEPADTQYRRAASYAEANKDLEAPNLWRRAAANLLAWGDAMFRDGKADEAMPIYGVVVADQDAVPQSYLYTEPLLQTIAGQVKAWLAAAHAGTTLPDLAPELAATLMQLRRRWRFLRAGLDFFGRAGAGVPPFTFAYLQDVARYFANQAIRTEQQFIEFRTRYEGSLLTRLDLQHASDVAAKQVDEAAAQEREATAVKAQAENGMMLSDLRADHAFAQLTAFNDSAWEARWLAGIAARGAAWTGGDLPRLSYTSGAGNYSGLKHEVLQQITMRQTELAQDAERRRLQQAASELQAARAIAAAQNDAAQAHLEGAQIQTQIALLQQQHANEMLGAFNSQLFTPEQWLQMATLMRQLSDVTLDRAVDAARLMQRAFNFENFDSRNVIRTNYRPNETAGLLGGEQLLADIDGFTHYQVTTIRQRPIPVKWALSLAETYPGQFAVEFKRTGRIEFDISVDDLAFHLPGTYRHQLAAVEVQFDGFLPPEGLHGRLQNSGLSRYRDMAGALHSRVQPVETLVLSPFSPRGDMALVPARTEMRPLFAGTSVASGWTLEVPRRANDVDLNGVFDARVIFTFECLFDDALYAKDLAPPTSVFLHRSRAISLRFGFPDAYYALREKGSASLVLAASDFPYNQLDAVLTAVALVTVPVDGKSLAGASLLVSSPANATPTKVTVGADGSIPRGALAVTGTPAATGGWTIAFAPGDVAHKDDVSDLILVLDYNFKPVV